MLDFAAKKHPYVKYTIWGVDVMPILSATNLSKRTFHQTKHFHVARKPKQAGFNQIAVNV
jgi:hypothetical protein